MKVRIVKKSTLVKWLLLMATTLGCAALMIWPQGAAGGVSRGLAICGQIIIPSLFPFLVITSFFVRSGLADRVGARLDRVTRRLFGLPGCCGAAVLIGAIGGYPAGAAAVRELLEGGRIGKSEARRLLKFCVNGGPAFIISTVGAGLLGSARKGVLLYACHLLASFLIGIACRPRQVQDDQKLPPNMPDAPWTRAFTGAVQSACGTLFGMCGFVMLFSALLTVFDVSGLTDVMYIPFTRLTGSDEPFRSVWAAFWEVSCGCVAIVGGRPARGLPFLLGMALGWGGLSVHCQIGGMFSEEKLQDKGYYLARLWQALLGGVLSALAFRFLPVQAVSAAAIGTARTVYGGAVSTAASVAMLLACGAFLFSVSIREKVK